METYNRTWNDSRPAMQEESLLGHAERVGVSIYLIVTGVLSLVGNLLVLAVFCRFRALRTRTYVLLVNLAVADLGISALGFPFVVHSAFRGRWVLGAQGCQWYAFNAMFFGLASIGALTIIALDRYILTCRYQMYLSLSKRHYAIMVTLTWGNAFLWALAPLLGWSSYALEPSSVACFLDLGRADAALISYILCLFLVCFLAPALLVGYSYLHIYRSIRTIGEGGSQENIEWTNHKQITKMSFLVVLLFALSWTPYGLLHLFALGGAANSLPLLVTLVPALCAKTATLYNPIIYVLLNRRFRLALRKLTGCLRSHRDQQAAQAHNLV